MAAVLRAHAAVPAVRAGRTQRRYCMGGDGSSDVRSSAKGLVPGAVALPYRKVPKWVRKTAVTWNSVEDVQRAAYAKEVNQSKWSERFTQQFLYRAHHSQTNWRDGRHEMEPDEPCYKQKPLALADFHMGDRIWPIAMLNANVIYLSIFLEKLTLVLVPGCNLHSVGVEVRDQCIVPMAYWNPKTEVKPFTVPSIDLPCPADVRPYWRLQFVDGSEHVVLFEMDAQSKTDVVRHLQEQLHELDKVDRNTWMGAVSASPDKNAWVRVKKHGLDDYTIQEHCPLRYM
eukprot:TRINITY_DN14331_c0_g1_i1.p2 TRINITY_DN14331_c0_g1~~TRINITY_DN14331_c0_g1_i1.p2  ORF type:complete len:285 (+),score=98.02 TRINITY_DN14331_c0_g1_i1:69-923(+)